MSNFNSEQSFQTLETLTFKLQTYIDEHSKDEEKGYPVEINETLMILFTLLFDFTEPGQVKVAEKCGNFIVQFISNQTLLKSSDPKDIDTMNTSLLIISALCNYSSARGYLTDNTPILKVCIDALVALKGNEPQKNSSRDKFLSCLSTLIRGNVSAAVDAGIVNPMIDLLGNDQVVTDQKGASGIILSLIEPERGQALGARVLLSGVVPMLFKTLAKKVPDNASATDRADCRNLQIIGLRCVACVLRHQKLARESAGQFFSTEEGESHLKSVVEHAKETSDVSRWIFAAEILVWLGTVQSCQGLLGRMGAKQALQQVVAEANPYGKWVSLVNQAVSLKSFISLWTAESIFFHEQHAFLAFWINRYSCGGLDVSADAYSVREKLCSREWLAFTTTLLASPNPITRKHANIALLSLTGEPIEISNYKSSSSSRSGRSSAITPKTKQYSHLLNLLGLEKSEESKVIETLMADKLPLHIILRPNISIESISKSLSKLALGTRLAVIDGIKDLRERHRVALEIVSTTVDEKVAVTSKLPKLVKQKNTNIEKGENVTYPECFISYCWAQKPKVKLLKQSIESHGIKCWMDEQQMEGGSMLFEEIDQGISDSSVVISCLSPEYTKSVNCNREVLLATDRKKTTIPVLVEELEQWPPRGNLGPILAGKLYIDLTDTKLGEGKDSEELQPLIQSVLQLLNTSTSNEI